jgi:opacity protein-like surface antigen
MYLKSRLKGAYMKNMFFLALLLASIGSSAQSANWNNSPNNINNSQSNWSNSSSNWNNSPSNWSNSKNNQMATNGIYGNDGKRLGYETKTQSGVTNFYDNNGNRIGYQPSNR